MFSKLLRLALAFGLGLILLVVSCAPAAEPTAAPTTAPPTPTSAPPAPTSPPPTTAPGVIPTASPTSAPFIATPRPPTPTPTPAAEQPRRGGVLKTTGTAFGFASWEECCSSQSTMINDSILEYVPSNNFFSADEEIRGRMAYQWSVSTDGLAWTLKLEDGMRAALPKVVGGKYDGTVDGGFEAVTCDDVAWTIMTIKTGEGLRRSMRGKTFAPVTRVDCPDPLTAVIQTKWPYAALPGMLAVTINDIKPKDFWKDRLKDLPAWTAGSGPWMLKSFIAGEVYIMEPNPYYHRKAPDGKLYPYLDRVEFHDITPAACGPALRTGRIHMCGRGTMGHDPNAETLIREAPHLLFLGPLRPSDNPEWAAMGGGKGVLGNNTVFLMAHHGKAPWNNVKLREAVSLALDRKTICEVAFSGWCVPGAFAFVLGTPWNLPKEQVWAYPGYNVATVEQNVAKARQTLTDLGYKLYPDPAALKIDLPAWQSSGTPYQPVVTEMLRRAGFNPNLYLPENQRVLAQVVSGEFEIVGWDQLVSHIDANQICYEHYFTGSDRNYGRYSSAQADALCDKMGQELDRAKRIALAHEFHKLVLDDHARATFSWRQWGRALSPDVRGFQISSVSATPNDRSEVWWLAK